MVKIGLGYCDLDALESYTLAHLVARLSQQMNRGLH